jgi:exosome complex RNA-binding protein Rrp4
MPIKSYVAFPHKGEKNQLIKVLENTKHCEVVPSTNKDVLVLVTDTKNDQEEEILQQALDAIEEIEHLNLVSGFNENASTENEKTTNNDETNI